MDLCVSSGYVSQRERRKLHDLRWMSSRKFGWMASSRVHLASQSGNTSLKGQPHKRVS